MSVMNSRYPRRERRMPDRFTFPDDHRCHDDFNEDEYEEDPFGDSEDDPLSISGTDEDSDSEYKEDDENDETSDDEDEISVHSYDEEIDLPAIRM